jgi:hypothetical protein
MGFNCMFSDSEINEVISTFIVSKKVKTTFILSILVVEIEIKKNCRRLIISSAVLIIIVRTFNTYS